MRYLVYLEEFQDINDQWCIEEADSPYEAKDRFLQDSPLEEGEVLIVIPLGEMYRFVP